MTRTPHTLATGFVSAESPRWFNGALVFSDMYAREVIQLAMDGRRRVLARIEGVPTGIGFLPDGDLLVASQRGRRLYRVGPSGDATVHADLNPLVDSNLNDMWVDSAGRAWVGSLGVDSEGLLKQLEQEYPTREEAVAALIDRVREQPGTLWRIDLDGTIALAADGVLLPNGLTMSTDEQTLYVNASLEPAVLVFALDATGTLIRTGRFPLDFPPDGMSAVDEEGAFWVADPEGHGAIRIGRDGSRLDRIDTTRKCLAVALGGPDGRTLFLCTTRTNDPALAEAERASSIETVSVNVPAL